MSAARIPVPPPPFRSSTAVILGRSFASQRAAVRLRDDLHLSVRELVNATAATYDDINNRWEIHVGRFVIARAKFAIDGDGKIHLQGREAAAIDPAAVTAHGFPNLFRPAGTDRSDSLGYTVACIDTCARTATTTRNDGCGHRSPTTTIPSCPSTARPRPCGSGNADTYLWDRYTPKFGVYLSHSVAPVGRRSSLP